jgi:hypothetical protein
MFSRWIVRNITSARGTLHCLKTRVPSGDQLVVCGLCSHRCLLLLCPNCVKLRVLLDTVIGRYKIVANKATGVLRPAYRPMYPLTPHLSRDGLAW